jgi:hypothetical protein
LTYSLVYFIYPETCGVRLEDMDALFGDSTTALATPVARGETGSLMGGNSPEPPVDYRRGIFGQNGSGITPANAIPGLDIDPPSVSIRNGRPQYTGIVENREGWGGWISRMVNRSRGKNENANGTYRPLDQDDD